MGMAMGWVPENPIKPETHKKSGHRNFISFKNIL
jgi:hypothetical protein